MTLRFTFRFNKSIVERKMWRLKDELLDEIGNKLLDRVKEEIRFQLLRGRVPPLAPSTILRKGHDLILLDTWTMYHSYTKKLYYPSPNSVSIGIWIPDVATYASVHEYGTERAGRYHNIRIPPRPVLRYIFGNRLILTSLFQQAIRKVSI